jgi:hypothetical protein
MVEEIRNHDAAPTEEETRWMNVDPVSGVIGLMVLAGLALAISVTVTTVVSDAPQNSVKSASANK